MTDDEILKRIVDSLKKAEVDPRRERRCGQSFLERVGRRNHDMCGARGRP